MNPARRAWLVSWGAGATWGAGLVDAADAAGAAGAASEVGAGTAVAPGPHAAGIHRGRRLEFPRDHGAHIETRTEWWYVTGWLARDSSAAASATAATPDTPPTHGFQVTFFRSRVVSAAANAAVPSGRFTPRHLLFAHAAVTDLAAGRHHHAQRIARWNGEPATGPDRAALDDAELQLGRWRLAREASSPIGASRWHTELRAQGFALQATLASPHAPLLQGDAGFSRKGPEEHQASHYYSLPQLDARLTLELNGQRFATRGRAWLDHEWSDEILHPQATGWDWIGCNLFDGGALTAFQLRRADGSALWAGGSFRAGSAGAAAHSFEPHEVAFSPGRRWRSPATNASYPMQWQVHTPAGRHTVRALLDAQELASRGGTGAVYWEGLAELLDEAGRRIGLGYLEMTGYAAPIKLG